MKTEANARAATHEGPFYRGPLAALARIEDGSILRVAFFALLAGTAGVLYVDFRTLSENHAALTVAPQPILPPATTESGEGRARPPITTSLELLEAPMSIELAPGGTLRLTGTIEPGAAERFAAEIEARGEYVETVVLDSPGGSVMDALAIGALIHEKGLGTEVPSGNLCASSCPLILASGAERRAGPDAAVGVHQVYAAALSADPLDALSVAGMAMSDAQKVTAEITRHLVKSGVDPELWIHALETPPSQLYYFTGEEMVRLKLVTQLTEN